jgi:hypothetical protein
VTASQSISRVHPARYRKKPVVVEIMWLDENSGDPQDIAAWCGGYVLNNLGHPSGKVAIVIPTLEGDMTAQYGDGIVKGTAGEFYPIKRDIAEATYEAVE